MTTDEYRYKLQEHEKNLKDYAEYGEQSDHPVMVSYRSLIDLSYSILQELSDTLYYRDLEVDDSHSEIIRLNGYVEFYQDILKKTNDALCDMINIVKEKKDDRTQT